VGRVCGHRGARGSGSRGRAYGRNELTSVHLTITSSRQAPVVSR
jgi:hypothetical protein